MQDQRNFQGPLLESSRYLARIFAKAAFVVDPRFVRFDSYEVFLLGNQIDGKVVCFLSNNYKLAGGSAFGMIRALGESAAKPIEPGLSRIAKSSPR